ELKRFLDYLDSLQSTTANIKSTTLYKLLLATGLRICEALALSWSDINFQNQTVSVSKTTVRRFQIQDTPKSNKSNRIISIDDKAIYVLKSWYF
ncbi:tyrosine-type recombinase/integrase, partial [Klebsiella pneumoniae]|uniref:tyrosine-type recombinase/integrase n=1 Tax=Klebsiella pneumoniae TaxID=573 RepID=UPI002730FB86